MTHETDQSSDMEYEGSPVTPPTISGHHDQGKDAPMDNTNNPYTPAGDPLGGDLGPDAKTSAADTSTPLTAAPPPPGPAPMGMNIPPTEAPSYQNPYGATNFANVTNPNAEVDNLRNWSMGLFFASIGMWFIGLLFSIFWFFTLGANIAGVVTAAKARKRGDRRSDVWFWLNIVGIILSCVGIVFAVIALFLLVGLIASSGASVEGVTLPSHPAFSD